MNTLIDTALAWSAGIAFMVVLAVVSELLERMGKTK